MQAAAARATPIIAATKSRDSDATLALAAKKGGAEAVEALVRRYWSEAHHAAYLVTGDAAIAEDAAQEALLRAVGALDRYDPRRPFGPWLHRIVVNVALDLGRSRERRGERPLEATHERPAPEAERVDDAMLDALSQLDAVDRAAVVLRHVFDYRSHEIGSMLSMPAATVRTRLRRSMAQLQRRLDPEEPTR